MQRIVLAYSGGLDTSVAIAWLKERYGAEVIAVTMDLGQGRELEAVRDRALAAGALRAHVLDLREEFARDYVLPALKADAMHEHRYPQANPLARALIAQKLVEVASIERADRVAHGCNVVRQVSDPDPLYVALRALNPALQVIAPAREWGMTRSEELAYASRHGISVPAAIDSPYRTDANLWGRSIECARLDDPWNEPPEEVYALTRAPADCPEEAAAVEVTFARGVPVAINGVTMPMLDLIGSLSTIGGAHGVGRLNTGEGRPAGIRSRVIYEAPAAVVLHAAHAELQSLVTSKDLERFCKTVSLRYADVIDRGLWFTPMRLALDAFVDSVQDRVTGAIRVRLFKGECSIVGRESQHSLHSFSKTSALPVEPAARKAPEAASRKLRVAR